MNETMSNPDFLFALGVVAYIVGNMIEIRLVRRRLRRAEHAIEILLMAAQPDEQ